MDLILLHNPTAGKGSPSADKLTKTLKDAGHRVRYQSTKDDGWEAALKTPADAIIAAGGDGTVRKVALNGPEQVLMAILPLGTANNIANSLGITQDWKEVIRNWSTLSTKRVDLGKAKGPWGSRAFIEGLGAGAIAETAARMDRGEGFAGDAADDIDKARRTLLMTTMNHDCHPFIVELDGKVVTEHAVIFEVANMCYMGPRLHLAPTADPGDGFLDVVWVRQDDRADFRDWLEKMPPPPATPPVHIERATKICIRQACSPIRLDDQFWPPDPKAADRPEVPEITLSLERAVLNVLLG